MDKRSGEKIGWIGGWFGGFLWVIALSILFVIQGKHIEAVIGFVLSMLGLLSVFLSAPWKRPNTVYWKLMVPLYVILFGSIAWALWAFGGLTGRGLDWWNLLLIFPVLTPLFTIGKKRWNDWDAKL